MYKYISRDVDEVAFATGEKKRISFSIKNEKADNSILRNDCALSDVDTITKKW
jgi:hypothetical protein